jgi:lambda family phage tail tape measure protein
MAKQIEDIVVQLGIQGFEELNKLRSSFRELTKVTRGTDDQLDAARKRLLELKTELGDTARANKGLTDAFTALVGEARRGSDVWQSLNKDLAQLRQESRLTDTQITALRDIIVDESKAHAQSAVSIREHVKSLQDLRNQATLNGKVHQQLGADIQRLTATLEQGEITNRKHYSSLTAMLAVKPDKVLKQWEDYNRILKEGTASADKLATAQRRLNQLSGAPRILERRRVSDSAAITQDPEYLRRFGFEGASLPELPNTNAAYAQQIKELQQDLANLDRNSIEYLQTLMQLTGVQRQSTEVARGYAQALLMGVQTKTVANSTRNLQEVVTALRAEMQQLDTTTSEGSAAYAQNANQVRVLEKQLNDLAGAYRNVSTMATQAATAEQNAANKRIRDNYFNRGMVRQQEAALAELGQRVRAGVSGTPLLLPAAGQTSARGTGLEISAGEGVRVRRGRRASVTYQTPGAEGIVPAYGVQPGGGVERFFGRGELGGANAPGRGVTPIGPVMTPDQESKNRTRVITEAAQAYDTLGKSVERSRRPLRDIYVDIDKTTKASNGSVNSLEAQIGVWTELRNAVGRTAPAFDTATKKLEQLTARRERLTGGRRLSGMQLAQGVGAALSGGIFGGPEGLIGGLAGLPFGVGGAFAGAAAGAQVGMFRQQLGDVTDYSARIDKLQIALRGILGSQDAYTRALAAADSATRDLNIPQEIAIRSMTQLSAAVTGAGGTVTDSAFAFRAVSEAVKATGGNAEQADGALLALTQVFSKGKVSAEELNQIAERLPGTFVLFAKAAGMTGPQLQKALQQGQVGLNDLMKFLQLISTEYGQTALKIADSSQEAGARLSVAMQNMQLEVGRALQPIGAALQNAFADFVTNTTPAAVAACKAIKNALTFIAVDPVGSELAKLTLNVGLATAGVLLLGPALKALAAAFTYAKTQVLALTAAMAKNPLTLLAIAATAAAIKVADVLLNQKRLNDEVQRSLNIASKAPSGSVASQIAKTEYELQAARKKAASELDKASDPFNFGFSAAEAAAQVVRLEDKLVSLKKTYKVRLELDTIFKGIDPTAGVPTGYKIVNGRLAYLSPGQGYIDAETGKPVAAGPTKFAEGQADGKDKQASSYLQAFEQREEAITQARLQREEQIAELRKQSLEQARQLERQFADERRALEREIAQSKRGTADIEEDIARQQRLLAGEDPRLIEAEQRIADVYREARERDIKIKEDYTDREFNRARTVADFQKNTADQINKANEAYAKTLGNIHRTYARDVGKILDEASGKTARRLAAAGKLITAISDLQALQAQRVQVGASPVPSAADMPPVYKQKLDDIERFNKQLLQSRRQQQVTADSFFTAYADQPQFEDVAGLQPFPLQKMLKQIGRPFTRLYNRIESAAESAYPYSRREVKQMLAPDPKRTQRVLERADRVENVRQTWSPVDAEWRQRDNNWRSNPRSKPAAASFSTFEQVLGNLTDTVFKKLNSQGAIYGILGDISDYLSDAQLRIIKTGIMEQLKQGTAPSRLLQHTDGRSSFTSRPNIKSAIKQLTLEAITELQRAGAKNGIAGEYSPLIFDQPRVVPGVGKDFEGAMLPGGFGTSKLARNLGNVASGQLQGVLAGLTNTLIAGTPYRVGDPVGPNIRPIPVQPATKGAPESSAAAKDAAQSQGAMQLALDLAEVRTKALEPLQAQTRRLQEQNDLYKAQQTYLQQGITPALAEQFAQVDQLGALQRQIAEREKTTAVNKATAANASRAEIDGLIQRHSTLTAQIDSNVQRVKDLAVAYEDAQKAARFTQDERIGLGIREGAEAYVQSIGTMREATAQLAQTGIKGVEDAIFSLTTTGKTNFQEFAKSVLESTSRMIIQQLILRSVMQIIGVIGGSSGGFSFSGAGPVSGASVFGSTQAGFNPLAFSGIKLNALGNAYAANGIVPFAMGGVVNQPTLFKFANGGAGRLGLMGEAGPEAIMPLRRLPNGRLGVEQAGGGAPVTVNVSVDASGTSVQGNAGQGEQLGRVISQAVQAELVRQQRPGGLLSR